MAEVNGATLIARSLKEQGVEYMFGIVGIPVVPIAMAFQREGSQFFGFRNEQSASYAAGAVGYMTGRPGACLGVSGPGMMHAIAGMANAWSNGWPMILLGGANDSYQNGSGAFQETPQIEAARPFAKYAARPDSVRRLPFYIEQAVRTTIYGKPGAVYLDLPGDIITGTCEEDDVEWKKRCPEPPRTTTPQENIDAALAALKSAERPLVIVGKGAAYARAEDEVREFVEKTQLPYLASPMGKGVIPDDHPLSVAPARSYALQNADLDPADGRAPELDHALWAAAAVQQGRPGDPDGHQPGGDRHERPDRGRAGRRREGDHGTAQRGPGREPVAVPGGDDLADGPREQGEREPRQCGAAVQGRQRAHGLLPRPRPGARPAAAGRDHQQRRREHDGHRPHGAAELLPAPPPGRRAPTARWALAWRRRSPRRW